jgi:hypothetical protein
MSTPRLNKGYVVLGAVALSVVACGGTSMPDVQSAFVSEEPKLTAAQREEMREAQERLAKAKAASEDAKLFKQSVTEERTALDQRRAGAAEAKASGPRPVIVTEETVRVTESVPPPEKARKPKVSAGRGTAAADLRELQKPEAMQRSRTKRSVEMREGNAVVVERRVTVESQAAGPKGSTLQGGKRTEEVWSAKNRFADDQFKLAQAQQGAAQAELEATAASIERERLDDLHWEGRAASARRLKAAKAESEAQQQVRFRERQVSAARADAEKSYSEWRGAIPRPKAPRAP